MNQQLLTGEQEYMQDRSDPRIRQLEDQIRDLKHELRQAQNDAAHEKDKAGEVLGEMRRLTLPFYRLLQAIHGEIDRLGVAETSNVASASPTTEAKKAVWDIWKQKLGSPCARIIDALLVHGTMTRTQLCITTGIQGSNIAKPISRLYTANLLNKNGSEYSLKQI